MNKEAPPDEHELVSCEICMKSIPRSDATNGEKDDYVAYFCGLDCYEQWQQQQSKHTTENNNS